MTDRPMPNVIPSYETWRRAGRGWVQSLPSRALERQRSRCDVCGYMPHNAAVGPCPECLRDHPYADADWESA